MKKLSLILCAVLIFAALEAQITPAVILEKFLLADEGLVFRGFSFEDMEDEIRSKEQLRPNCTYTFQDLDENKNLIIGFDIILEDEQQSIAYVDYYIDQIGIYEVVAQLIFERDQLTVDVYDELNKYYNTSLGNGIVEANGWTRYTGKYYDEVYDVWTNLSEDESGQYIRYKLKLVGSD